MAFDAYHKWLGIPPKEQPPHHYRLLGLGLYESDPDVIDAAANRQMAYVQSCASGQHLEQSQVLLNELSAARLCLLTPQRKQQYDALLQKAVDAQRIGAEPTSAQAHAFSSHADPSNQVHRKRGSDSLAAKLVLILFIVLGGALGLFVGKSILDRMHPPKDQVIAPDKMEVVFKDSFGRIIPSEIPRDLPTPSSSAATHATRRPLPTRPSLRPTVVATPRTDLVGSPPQQITGTVPIASTTNSVGMRFVLVPAGAYVRGSTDDVDEPQHRVQITRPFYIGETEVTQSQWQAVMATTPWRADQRVRGGNDYPATNVIWDEAVEFCRTLSVKEGKEYRLPTEAEWEYACRAGTTTKYSFGNDASQLGDYAWTAANASDVDENEKYPHVVKQKRPNAWGLYDMHGNVYEWCSDFYGAYPKNDVIDPTGIAIGVERVTRGGCWNNDSYHCRSADRSRDPPDFRWIGVGFRIVQQVLPQDSLSGQESSIATTTRPLMPNPTATPTLPKPLDKATMKTSTGTEAPKDTTAAGISAKGMAETGAPSSVGVQATNTPNLLADEFEQLELSISSQSQSRNELKVFAEQAFRLASQASNAKDEQMSKRFILLAFRAGRLAEDTEMKTRAVKRMLLFRHDPPQTITIAANQSWQNSGAIKRGDMVVISSTGTWDVNAGTPQTQSGDGAELPAPDGSPLPGVSWGALVGRIGTHVFLVGSKCAFEAELDGNLEFAINDDGVNDNRGTLIITGIRISQGDVIPKERLPTVAINTQPKQTAANQARPIPPVSRLANIESLNWRDHYLTPENSEFRLTTLRPQSLLKVHFNKFAPDTVAFESVARPGWYLVEFKDEIGFLQFVNDKAFKQHASFTLSKAFGTDDTAYHSFESSVAKGRFILHANFKFYVRSLENEDRTSATFRFKFVDK